jgi:hypothetical protein
MAANSGLRRQAKALLSRFPPALALIRRLRSPVVQRIPVDYRVEPVARYGYGKPPHALLNHIIRREREAYRETLQSFLQYEHQLAAIPTETSGPTAGDPYWQNDWFQGIDVVALYSLVALRRPALYFEIGSGQSTRIVRKAIVDHRLPTRIVSLDPQPWSAIDAICDEVIRGRLEDCDLSIFGRLQPGDMLFFDGSHRSFQNSDVTVFFLDVLPQLAAGVIVHIHDIFLPYDYPPEWTERYYSEQYLLATHLLAPGPERLRIILPNAYVSQDTDLGHVLDPLWNRPELAGIITRGASFWFES